MYLLIADAQIIMTNLALIDYYVNRQSMTLNQCSVNIVFSVQAKERIVQIILGCGKLCSETLTSNTLTL